MNRIVSNYVMSKCGFVQSFFGLTFPFRRSRGTCLLITCLSFI